MLVGYGLPLTKQRTEERTIHEYPLAAFAHGKRVVVDEFLILQKCTIDSLQVKRNVIGIRLTLPTAIFKLCVDGLLVVIAIRHIFYLNAFVGHGRYHNEILTHGAQRRVDESLTEGLVGNYLVGLTSPTLKHGLGDILTLRYHGFSFFVVVFLPAIFLQVFRQKGVYHG